LYYGDEIGMLDVAIAPELVRDPWEKNVPGLGLGRDPERTPMQWSAEPGAGFSKGQPWLPLAADFESVNVARAASDPGSLLQLYRALLALRRSEPALAHGGYRELHVSATAFGYERHHEQRRLGVFLNLDSRPTRLPVPAEWGEARILLATAPRPSPAPWGTELRANEGVIVQL
jgi:alpha-glucosidase